MSRTNSIYVDGSCLGNPGPGGYGVAVFRGTTNIFNVSVGERSTTNNRMELMAMLTALEIVEELGEPFDIYSDSTYTINGLTKWMCGWKKRGWTKGTKDPLLNTDIWKKMYEVYKDRNVEKSVSIHKVKAHCGIPGNELADMLANEGANSNAKN